MRMMIMPVGPTPHLAAFISCPSQIETHAFYTSFLYIAACTLCKEEVSPVPHTHALHSTLLLKGKDNPAKQEFPGKLKPMGEGEKKPEETKMEEKKPEEPEKAGPEEAKQQEKSVDDAKDEKKPDESKDAGDGKESKEQTPPPPPPDIVLKVYMHCEGCARKVRRSLKGFPGVEEIITDCKAHRVVVKGEKADPLKVLERVQRKSHRQVELLSPIPKPPVEEEKKPEEKENPKSEEKKEEPEIVTVVLKVHMHCEACAQEIKRCIQRMKGVESAEPDLKKSEVSVKGVFETAKLVEYVHKRTGKQAVIVKQEPEEKTEKTEEGGKEEKKGEGGEKAKEGEEKKRRGSEGKEGAETEETKVVELKRNEYYYYPPRYTMEMYAYPPQIFSDENPNACSVM
ncbi:heavy metal-associated isoprenylated plant protein 7-like [Prosopis cineraria]|uniref:heavy metal-associated isoprenylated plant protein 7-like n=1 Tax=Prosopis cineraria TaxID=364024 RepID=UPI0024106CB7|nr:heavy metal-associated isoprenylated plant protein 7-like [Prosopis cineraria]